MQVNTQTTKQIQALITKAVKAANSSKQAIQDAIEATVKHAWQYGDVSLINRLVADLPKGVQLEKLKQYIQECAPVRPHKSTDIESKGAYKYKAYDDEIKAISLSLLNDVAWWDYVHTNNQQQNHQVDTAKIFKHALTGLLKKLKEQTDLTSYEVAAMQALEKAVVDRAERAERAERAAKAKSE